jgi:glycine reductase
MQLTLADFPVRQILFGSDHRYQDGLLGIDQEDLVRLVSQDARIESARFDVVNPGDRVRVTGIRDVISRASRSTARRRCFPA